MHYDLIIKNGTLVTPQESITGDIAVKDGKIAKTGNLEVSDTANETYDAQGLHVLPGIIDAHVHFRDPGLCEKEDFETGSIAAAMGGITMVADMPNVIPVTSDVQRFKEKLNIIKEKSYVDFALYALLNNADFNEMKNLKDAGALGFKIFLGTSTGDITSPSPSVLWQLLTNCARLGIRTGFHCETSELNTYFTNIIKENPGSDTGIMLSNARPVISEVLAIQTVISFARYTNAKVHIHHITSHDGALLAQEARKDGIDLTTETCPHYLLFDALNNTHKVYPPIRAGHRKKLFEAVNNGIIDMIASDHAPHTAGEKEKNIWDAPAGLCGVETLVPVLLNKINKGELSLNDFVRLASEMPAKIWGIYPKKGNLLLGADADITIVDMKMKNIIRAQMLHSKSKTSPYEGMEVQGMPVCTIIRGKFVMKDRVLTGEKGYGIFVS
ncbi:MAG: dihydroorotase family protein [Treponema sp.]|nr:dihydroorotase family protein [Treponema sp.]